MEGQNHVVNNSHSHTEEVRVEGPPATTFTSLVPAGLDNTGTQSSKIVIS